MEKGVNELVLGLELRESYVRVFCYHRSMSEPQAFRDSAESVEERIPFALDQQPDGSWQIPEVVPDMRLEEESGTKRIWIYPFLQEPWKEADSQSFSSAGQLFAAFFACLKSKLQYYHPDTRLFITITVKALTQSLLQAVREGLTSLGIQERDIRFQDQLTSFYYYAINQKKELRMQDVALLDYDREQMLGYLLHIDYTVRPAVATVKLVASQDISEEIRGDREEAEWNKEKDRLLFEMLKKLFERRTIAVTYVMNAFYDRSWAVRSIQYLCYKKRAYQGNNLYAKGACYAAMERAGILPRQEILYGSGDMISWNLGMQMRIRGKETYYPLVTAGETWYEIHHVCELIPCQENAVRLLSQSLKDQESVMHILRFGPLPGRPDRTIRLRMTLWFLSPSKCRIELEDMGFGQLYPSSGQKWERTISFSVEDDKKDNGKEAGQWAITYAR